MQSTRRLGLVAATCGAVVGGAFWMPRPGSVTGVSWSDHRSFWDVGVPALMMTDTAPFRDPYYHRSTDTPGRLDYERMARLATGLASVVLAEAIGSERTSSAPEL